MLHYKHILVATCLTPAADAVLQKAKELAEQSGAKLSLVHVLEQTAAAYGGEFSTTIDVEYEQRLEKELKHALHNQGQTFGIADKNQYFLTGAIKHAVVDLADDIDCDLIMVGSHSHHGLEVLLGSKANAILHIAKCDVLAVRVRNES